MTLTIERGWTKDLRANLGKVIAFYPFPGARLSLKCCKDSIWISTFSPGFAVRLSRRTGDILQVVDLEGWGSMGLFRQDSALLIPSSTELLYINSQCGVATKQHLGDVFVDHGVVPPAVYSSSSKVLVFPTTTSHILLRPVNKKESPRVVQLCEEEYYISSLQSDAGTSVFVGLANNSLGSLYEVNLNTSATRKVIDLRAISCGCLVNTQHGIGGVTHDGEVWFAPKDRQVTIRKLPCCGWLKDFCIIGDRVLVLCAGLNAKGKSDTGEDSVLSIVSFPGCDIKKQCTIQNEVSLSAFTRGHDIYLAILKRYSIEVLRVTEGAVSLMASTPIQISEEAMVTASRENLCVSTRDGVVSYLDLSWK